MPKRKTRAARRPPETRFETSDNISIVNLFSPAHFGGTFLELKSGEKVPVRCGCHRCLPSLKTEGLEKFKNPLAGPPRRAERAPVDQPTPEEKQAMLEDALHLPRGSLKPEYRLVRSIMAPTTSQPLQAHLIRELAALRGGDSLEGRPLTHGWKLVGEVLAEMRLLEAASGQGS